MNPGPYSTITAFVLLLLLFLNYCCIHPYYVTCASPGVAELTTQLRRPLGVLWLPLCRINKSGYTTREDYCDPLYLWDIKSFLASLPGIHSSTYWFTWEVYTFSLLSLLWLLSMVNFFETRSYWQGGFTEYQQEYYKEYRLSQKGIHLWKIINTLNNYARDLCLNYDISYCCDESSCSMN